MIMGSTRIVRGDYGDRFSRADIIEKFHVLNENTLGEDRADKVAEAVDRLDSPAGVCGLTNLLEGRSAK